MAAPTLITFAAYIYEQRAWPWGWFGRKRARQDLTFSLRGDSVIVTLPPPVAYQLELDALPVVFAQKIALLCTAPRETEKTT